ncbi:von Willebrand factor A domain-containing protein 5A [Saguinus oedipus]|uniref:von Willebrand factor A domain-containing protein 5A n=1 Tax=Saguinus oedipus TaxID=9490 RepID=A0ABQ9URI4_SAGOE|nr:von Willebrand factor A domain-containing protein 5A [Saguinus oedipus]
MVQFCGLLTLQRKPVPLKNISVTVSIYEFVAGVSATLNYENEEEVPLEAIFVFPMDEDSAVYSFEALVDGTKIVAELQDKMKARTNYKNAISQGHQAFLLEEDSSSRDVFSCNVGNLQPGSKAAVTLKYVQELPLETDGALRFVLPAVLNPRYKFSGSPMDSCLDVRTPIVPVEDLPYTLSMIATIDSQHGIEKVQSNCPLSPTEYLGEDKTSAQVSLAAGHKFDRDVELLIYYSEVHTPSVVLEMGMPNVKPGHLMGDPTAMVSFYPNIPEDQPSNSCGEFIFLMDRSGSMQSPMNSQDRSQLRIQAAKGVKYTQQTMEEALGRVKLMQADLGGTEILAPLQDIYRRPSIPGHPLQVGSGTELTEETARVKSLRIYAPELQALFVFTDGEVTDTFSVIKEVGINRQKHRCFSFGIGEGASTSLIKGIARASGGTSEFITGKDRMQPKAAETTGEVRLKYTLQGKTFEDKVTFPLQPKPDANLTIHRLAAKSLLQTKDMGLRETPASDKKDALNLSLESGVISSFTAFIAINKELNKPVQGPLAHRNIPRPIMLSASAPLRFRCKAAVPVALGSYSTPAFRPVMETVCFEENMVYDMDDFSFCGSMTHKDHHSPDSVENHLVQLIYHQNANGSWDLNEDLAKVLGMSLEEIIAAHPAELVDSSGWATILAMIWLHGNGKDFKCEWELLERKAMAWMRVHAGCTMPLIVKAAITFLKSSVDPAIFTY